MRMIKTLALSLVIMAALAATGFADVSGENGKTIPSASVNIPVSRVMTGDRYTGGDTVIYTLTAESAECPMPRGTSGLSRSVESAAGMADFGDIIFEYPGAYYYAVTRSFNDTRQITHEDKAYRVMIAKFNTGETLMVSWDKSTGEKTEGIIFTDRYTAPAGPETGDMMPWNDRAMLALSAAALLIGMAFLLLLWKENKGVKR